MPELSETNHVYFEDIEDMMDHAFESLQNAIFDYCLCAKIMCSKEDDSFVKAVIMQFVDMEFDDTYPNLTPYIEKNGKDTTVYGSIKKQPTI